MFAGSMVDSWDKVREQAASALLQLPSPLPGLETCQKLLPQLHWTCGLLSSPRVREADAGAPLCMQGPQLGSPKHLCHRRCRLKTAGCFIHVMQTQHGFCQREAPAVEQCFSIVSIYC